MSQEGSEQNKSEQPTSFRLQKARERGAVARSPDLAFLTGLSGFLLYVWAQGGVFVGRLSSAMRDALVAAPQVLGSERALSEIAGAFLSAVSGPFLLMLATVVALVIVFEIGQLRGLIFSAAPLKPDFTRLNPATGLKRIFSPRLLIEALKAVLKLAVYSSVAGMVILGAASAAAAIVDADGLASAMAGSARRLMAWFALAALAFAILDQVIVRREFLKKMRMSRREVKREHRDREGDARLKQRRKDLHKEFSKLSESLRGIRGADVLITNPTHFAVALRYDPATMEAPILVSRGAHRFAARLRRLAFLYGVAIIESPPLARALYRGELGAPVPEALFEAVAGVYRGLRARRAEGADA